MRKRMAQPSLAEQRTEEGRAANQPGNANFVGLHREQSHFRHAGANGQGAMRGGSLRQKGGVGFLLRNAEEHKLTPQQQAQLTKLKVQHELKKVDLLAELQKAKIILRSLAHDHETAEQDVMDAIDKVCACEAELRKMRYRNLKAAHAILDKKQLTHLKTYHQTRLREKHKALRLVQSD